MTTTLPMIVPSLTPTSSPTRKSDNYNDNNTLLSLNNNQNTTPISSYLNSNKTPVTPDSCNSSSFTNKLPKIKLILKLPTSSSNSPKERTGSKTTSLLHKPINIPPSASSANNLINKSSLKSPSQTVLMIDEIMNTLFDTTEILLRRSKNSDNSQRKNKKHSDDTSKSKTKNTKLRKVRSNTNKIKKTPVKYSPSKKINKKKQTSNQENNVNILSNDNNTIESNDLSKTNNIIKEDESKFSISSSTSSISTLSLTSNIDTTSNSSLTLPKSNDNNDNISNSTSASATTDPSNQSFKLKKIKFIYNANEEEGGKRKRKSGNQKTSSPKKKRGEINISNEENVNTLSLSKNLYVNNNNNNDADNNNNNNNSLTTISMEHDADLDVDSKQAKKKGRKRASPTKKTTKSTKTKKINESILPVNQKSPPQRSPKLEPQTKSYQMSKLDSKNVNVNTSSSYNNNNNSKSNSPSTTTSSTTTPLSSPSDPSSKSTFKLNLTYTPSFINKNDNSRFNSYLSSVKSKNSYVHSPLTNSFTFDQTQNSIISNSSYNTNEYIPSKLGISTTIYDPNSFKINKPQISPTNQILNNNLWKKKSKNINSKKVPTISNNANNNNKSKKEKISIIDVLKRESQLFTSSSKKLHSKSSISSYYGKPSLRRFSSIIDEAKIIKPLSIESNTSNASSIISTTKSIITSSYRDDTKYNNNNNNNNNNKLIIKNKNKSIKQLKDEKIPTTRVKSFSTPASPKNLSEDSLRTKAHSYIQRSLTTCSSLTKKFEFHSILGYGSNGVVLGARRRSDNLEVAIKYIYKTPSSKVCEEVNILKEVSPHPSIIRYIDSFEDNNCIYLITEKSGSSWVPSEDSNQILTCESSTTGRIVLYSTTCNTSSLFDYIELNGCVPPPEQKRMFKAIAEAVYALHSHNIVHGDIKEENILIDANHHPKLCDFGHARHIGNNAPPHFAVYGTLELSAPELMPNLNVPAHLTKTHVVKRYNGMAQDIWALGLVLYTMTHGELPLNHSKVISKEIDLTSTKYKEYPCSYNSNLNKDCVHLIRRMLTVDMKKRATIKEILNHPWLKKK